MADTAVNLNPTVPAKAEDKKTGKEYKVLKAFNTGAEDGEKAVGEKLKESESNPAQISYLLADGYIEE
jgi:hypothetical protein